VIIVTLISLGESRQEEKKQRGDVVQLVRNAQLQVIAQAVEATGGFEKGTSMQVATVQAASEDVRTFMQEYFDAWKGTDEQTILTYYSDDVVISLPTGALEGKTAVRDNFVRPSRQGELDANRLSAASTGHYGSSDGDFPASG